MIWRILPLAFLALPLAAQDNPPVIKMTTRQVQVSVVVHDKKGHPVAGLTKDDFAIYDGGDPQQIRYFAREASAPEARPAKAAALPPGVVSNRAPGDSGNDAGVVPAPLTAILVDSLNTSTTDRQWLRSGILKYLNHAGTGSAVEIYSLGNNLRMIPSRDVEAISKYANMQIFPEIGARRGENTLFALQAIANHLSGIPGRKNLIWLSHGFPFFTGTRPNGAMGRRFQSLDREEQLTLRALNDALISVYPIDVRGVATPFDYMPSMNTGSARSGQMAPPIPGKSAEDRLATNDINNSQESMQTIAARTGGIAYKNGNDIPASIAQALSDSTSSYLLSYTPTHNEWDGRYREVKITMKRPALEARYRAGYYATPEATDNAEAGAAAVKAASESELIATGLGLAAKIAQFPNAAVPRIRVTISIDARDLSFSTGDKGEWSATVDVVSSVRNGEGAPIGEQNKRLKLSLNPREHEQALKIGIPIEATLDPPAGKASWGAGDAGAASVRVTVRDAGSGAVGSVDAPLTLSQKDRKDI